VRALFTQREAGAYLTQARKKRVLEEVRKQRQRRMIISLTIVAILVGTIGYAVYAITQTKQGPTFPFPCLAENVTLHVHPWLRIWIENSSGTYYNVTIPTAIGILNPQISNGLAGGGSCFEPLHTHDSTGIIHVESAHVSDTYTIGDFFNVWAATPGYGTVSIPGLAPRPVVFNSTDIFGFRPDQTHTLSLLIDQGQSTYRNSTAYGSQALVPLDYCSTQLGNTLPCSSTAGGNPAWGGGSYPYGTGHTIVIYYKFV
jgi:hypothetical protein